LSLTKWAARDPTRRTLLKPAGEATLAPEDIRPWDYVAVLHDVYEYPTWLWCDDGFARPRDEAVRVRFTLHDDAAPLKVLAVCLPFVLVHEPCGRRRTIDVRRRPLARFGEDVWRGCVAGVSEDGEGGQTRCDEFTPWTNCAGAGGSRGGGMGWRLRWRRAW
jgi:hypothetical protein